VKPAAPVEGYADLRQEYLQVLAAQFLLCRDADFLQHVATPDTGIRVDPRKRVVVVSGLKVGLFLLCELGGHPSDDRYINMSAGRRHIHSMNAEPSIRRCISAFAAPSILLTV